LIFSQFIQSFFENIFTIIAKPLILLAFTLKINFKIKKARLRKARRSTYHEKTELNI